MRMRVLLVSISSATHHIYLGDLHTNKQISGIQPRIKMLLSLYQDTNFFSML